MGSNAFIHKKGYIAIGDDELGYSVTPPKQGFLNFHLPADLVEGSADWEPTSMRPGWIIDVISSKYDDRYGSKLHRSGTGRSARFFRELAEKSRDSGCRDTYYIRSQERFDLGNVDRNWNPIYWVHTLTRLADNQRFSIGNLVQKKGVMEFFRLERFYLDGWKIQGIDGEYITSFPSGIGVKLDSGIYVDLADLVFVLQRTPDRGGFINDTRERAPEHPISGIVD